MKYEDMTIEELMKILATLQAEEKNVLMVIRKKVYEGSKAIKNESRQINNPM
jgi:hypothetical protein